MRTFHAYQVVPTLPESLQYLRTLAYNVHWSWERETLELFRRLDRSLWENCSHNPVRMLGTIDQERLKDAASDDSYLAGLEAAYISLETYMKSRNTWFHRNYVHHHEKPTIAYFCMEFGLTECLPIYSGGLGVLAGDHLKSSSDLGVPLMGVGLLYQQGYFRQYLNQDGWQQERYPENDFYNMPIQQVLDNAGQPIRVQIDLPGRPLFVQVWKVQVGRVSLFLLDTNLTVNRPDDQNITDQLYGGNSEMRLLQEIVLGIGGQRALEAMSIRPTLCHMNEGHSAFQALERARVMMKETGCSFEVAREACASGSLFTTHTPVPAGFDLFSADLLRPYFSQYVSELTLSFDEFMELGRVNRTDRNEQFNMAVLALRTAHHVNGVSKLHGLVSRRMAQAGYRDLPIEEIPVSSVTNGIHARSFTSSQMAQLLDKYIGGRWSQDVSGAEVWDRVDSIPDEELWRVKQLRKERLVQFARNRLVAQYKNKNAPEADIRMVKEVLHPDALTIGFARRFATYKRATLLLSDQVRLLKLLNNEERPVQIIMAGKSHPHDDGGKELIRQIVQFAHTSGARSRIVFLEDYDLNVARYLVQGVDVWLNTPRRPMEASGTSGMKVLANGGLNLSILDGWWDEAYSPGVGWAIGHGEEYSNPDEQDAIEATALFELLEKEVVPLYYDRNASGLPRSWIARMKNSMSQLCPVFNTHRMVSEYTKTYYMPAIDRYEQLTANQLERAVALVNWKEKVRNNWSAVKILDVNSGVDKGQILPVGATLNIVSDICLGELTPDDVIVEAYHGQLDVNHQVTAAKRTVLKGVKAADKDTWRYEGSIICEASGMQGFTMRVLPSNSDAELPQEMALVAWE